MIRQIMIFTIVMFYAFEGMAADPVHRGVSIRSLFRKPDKTPVELVDVDINVKVLSGTNSSDCILLEEFHTNSKISNGILQVVLGKGQRLNANTTPIGKDPDKTLNQVLFNAAPMPALFYIDGSFGCTYSDTTNTQPRVVRITFNDGATAVTADFAIRGNSNTVNAESIEGITRDQVVALSATATQSALESAIAKVLDPVVNPANDGKSFRYNSATGQLEAFTPLSGGGALANNSVGGSAIADLPFAKVTGLPSALSSTKGLKECANGEILKYNGTEWTCAVDIGGGVSSVAGRTGDVVLTTSDITDLSSAVDSHVQTQRGAASGVASLGASGKINPGELITGASCTNGQGFSYNSVTDSISCAVLGTNVTGSSDLANGKVFIGDSNSKSQAQAFSGELTITNAGVASLAGVGTSGTYHKVTTDVQGRIVSGANLIESDIPYLTFIGDVTDLHNANVVRKIQGLAVDATLPLDGQALLWDNTLTKWKPQYVRMQDVRTSWGGTGMIPTTPCVASESMVWTSVTNRFSCQTIGNLDATKITSGNVAAARLPAASATADGIISQGNQSIAGIKTLLADAVAQGTLAVTGALTANGGVTTTTITATGNFTVAGKGSFDRVKLSNSATTCAGSSDEGKMRYNSSAKVMEFCNGNSWVSL